MAKQNNVIIHGIPTNSINIKFRNIGVVKATIVIRGKTYKYKSLGYAGYSFGRKGKKKSLLPN